MVSSCPSVCLWKSQYRLLKIYTKPKIYNIHSIDVTLVLRYNNGPILAYLKNFPFLTYFHREEYSA